MVAPFERDNCASQREFKTVGLISVDVPEGSRSAHWSKAFAIDSSDQYTSCRAEIQVIWWLWTLVKLFIHRLTSNGTFLQSFHFFSNTTNLKEKLSFVVIHLHICEPPRLPLLINSAAILQFILALIQPPSVIPMKPIIARLFILSTVSDKIFSKNDQPFFKKI